MASKQEPFNDEFEREVQLNVVGFNRKFLRLRNVISILTILDTLSNHPDANKDYFFQSSLSELTTDLEIVATELADLYGYQKTTEADYRRVHLTISNIISQVKMAIRRAKLPNEDEKKELDRKLEKYSKY